jgi:dTDP-4-dehydrorhamnose 3,5-epimerase
MQITPTNLPDVLLIEPKVFGDERGFFMETYQARKFAEAGLPTSFVQDNHSRSRQGTLRGLHYQIQQAQGKLLRVILGEIFDVAVDIRRSSATFGRWVGTILSAHNKQQLWVPPGFAHGFYVTSDWAELLYKTTDFYAPEWERTLRWDDPDLAIEWPLIEGQAPILSAKDAQGKILHEAELFD